MGFESVVRTHIGCRRKINEDSVLCRPELGLWAVADGMGGHDAGEVASALVVERLAAGDAGSDLTAKTIAAKRAIETANAELVAMGNQGPSQRTIGSTVVAIAAAAGELSCLWAGDSRAYRVRGGALVQLTRDHSLVQELVDAGQLDAAEANDHPNSNIVTRAVGASPNIVVDVVASDIALGDVFLLASDGLTRLATDAELLAGLQAPNLEAAADRFIDTCLERGAPDNVSFVILRSR
ncbi:MAG TPA: protein phosphatase 2C domain-containing protein [Caulobacteraceae bacterium]|nr:protein phosphatase 2C domain-containing protein [Caulobacteraceae bacterium]